MPLPPTHAQEAEHPAPEDRVPVREKIAYAAGTFTQTLGNNIDNGLLRPIFTVTLGVSPALMGVFDVIYRVWDALTDMLVGWLSDNTRTRWGRRRPYIVVGSVLVACWMPVLWIFNPAWELSTIIAWMVGCQLLLFLFSTIWNIPYQSLLLELTPSSVERTNVLAARGYIGWLPWMVVGWAWSLVQLPIFNDADGQANLIRGAFWITVAAAACALVAGMIPGLFCRERFYHQAQKQEKLPLLRTMRLSISNPVFLCLALVVFFKTLAGTGTEGLGFFAKLYHVFGGDQKAAAAFGGISVTIGLALGVAAVPLTQWSARRYGKRFTLLCSIALGMVAGALTLVTYSPKYPALILVNAFINSVTNGVLWMMVPSMLGDIVDHDELRTGERREGVFSAMFSWTFKASGSLAAAASGFLVAWTGYDAKLGVAQPEGVITSMRVWLVVLSLAAGGAAFAATWFYPLTTRRVEEIRAQLEARRGKLTG